MKFKFSVREKKTDLIFASVALAAILVMLILLFKYTGLRKQKEEMTDGYASVTEELITARQARSALEAEIETATQQLNEIKKQISALGGDQ